MIVQDNGGECNYNILCVNVNVIARKVVIKQKLILCDLLPLECGEETMLPQPLL